MKLATAQINSFLQKPDPAVRVILIYGPDSGLVQERALNLAKKSVPDINDPFSVALLTGAMLSDDHARLADEMGAQSLMGGRRLVRIQHATEAVATALTKLDDEVSRYDSLTIIEGGDLDKKSKLRSWCENSPFAVAIPCYQEDAASRSRTITDHLRGEGFTLTEEALHYLSTALPPDRLALRSELEKLSLYARGQKEIDITTAQNIIIDAGAAESDEAIFAMGMGDSATAMRLLDKLEAEQVSTVAILRAAQRHFMRLQLARQMVDQGLSASEATERLQPPVFWKQKAAMTKQISRWTRPRLERALSLLAEAEVAAKRTGTPDSASCAQLFLALAR